MESVIAISCFDIDYEVVIESVVAALIRNVDQEVMDMLPTSVKLVIGDVGDPAALRSVVEGCNKIIYFSTARSSITVDLKRVDHQGVYNLSKGFQDYNNKLAQLRAGKSSKSKLLLAKFKSAESLNGCEVRKGRLTEGAVGNNQDLRSFQMILEYIKALLKVFWLGVVEELLWFISGSISAKVTDIYHPLALRRFLLGTHYRSPVNYSIDPIEISSDAVYYIYQELEANAREQAQERQREWEQRIIDINLILMKFTDSGLPPPPPILSSIM
ncbi:high chlorophyll fluorescence phenotype protein [Tanacetum coccineum]|uniref:High chlorophyll fluorescence phenotype protein n=1 Tax=Tanacetum coccineum TaxID=301880 RepID=A0ABQ5G039_9ASTR